jgi:F-type H+-transporting ATPase subunit a
VQYFGVRERGAKKYARSFAEPMAFMLPLNILGQLSRTVAMALRLFGNVIAGEIVGAVMFQLLPLLGPIPFSLLGIITGLVQALVFGFLTVTFVVEAIGKQAQGKESVERR